MSGRRGWGRACALLLTVLLWVSLVPPAMAAAATARPWDFNGDGRPDMAVGVPGENAGAGAVVVMRGTATGVRTRGSLRFSQADARIPGTPEAGDQFGAALASGDFDGDGYADLAVSTPREGTATDEEVGTVTVLYGDARGLSTARAHRLPRPAQPLGDPDPAEDAMGFGLAAADFNGDGRHDLVVSTNAGRGGVLVFAGRATGLGRVPVAQIGPHFGLPELGGAFPGDLAVGDLDGNGVSDLVIGAMESQIAEGAVVVVYSARGRGLDVAGKAVPAAQVWTQDSPGVESRAESLDAFGSAVGVGDVTGDGRNDLVVAALQEPNGDTDAIGALHVLKGSARGVTANGDVYLRHDALITDALGALGDDLAVGDLDGDRIADVAVSAGHRTEHRWGRVLVLKGSSSGLSVAGQLTQADAGIPGRLAAVDYWGSNIRIRNVGGARPADLLVSDPYEVVGGRQAGMVTVLWGATGMPPAGTARGLTQESPGVVGGSERHDRFGGAI
ncbi:MAG TPA: FG-GAP-like repeat-containing protein [Egibacteraceae bacterium]|nr:FG-GAP-like repeat-containing protein [Egibacteraceae bacterium]